MSGEHAELSGPNFSLGFRRSEIPDGGMVAGHANGKAVLVARQADELFAIGATARTTAGRSPRGSWSATRCAAPGTTPASACAPARRCAAPALNPVACWRSSSATGRVYVRREDSEHRRSRVPEPRRTRRVSRRRRSSSWAPAPPGNAAAEMLRREGYAGPHHDDRRRGRRSPTTGRTSRRTTSPAPRPRSGSRCARRTFYEEQRIELVLGARVAAIDVAGAGASCSTTATLARYGALLLATGAEPVRLPTSRARTAARALPADARRQPRDHRRGAGGRSARWWSARASSASRSRRRCARAGSRCTSSRPTHRPLERVLGPELGDFIRGAPRGARRRRSTSAARPTPDRRAAR